MAGPVRETIMVSALQHYAYCPRQCALIHVDMAWEDNLFTMRGHRAHEIIDIPQGMTRAGLRVETALPIWSEELGLIGRADVVEFLPDGTPYPVEHKVGPRKYKRADEICCAQAICLEEMLGRPVPEGALFYRKSRRRRRVGFDAELMRAVHQIVVAVRLLMTRQIIPPPVADARCTYCSLKDICLPSAGDLLREAEERG